ncbi:MAG: hypothetical protein MJZ99_10105 [Bacteroidales bacterium]|nr:hypothetical protein [Bacteroidales bacterium]
MPATELVKTAIITFKKLKGQLIATITQFELDLYFNQGERTNTFIQMLQRFKQEYAESLR